MWIWLWLLWLDLLLLYLLHAFIILLMQLLYPNAIFTWLLWIRSMHLIDSSPLLLLLLYLLTLLWYLYLVKANACCLRLRELIRVLKVKNRVYYCGGWFFLWRANHIRGWGTSDLALLANEERNEQREKADSGEGKEWDIIWKGLLEL